MVGGHLRNRGCARRQRCQHFLSLDIGESYFLMCPFLGQRDLLLKGRKFKSTLLFTRQCPWALTFPMASAVKAPVHSSSFGDVTVQADPEMLRSILELRGRSIASSVRRSWRFLHDVLAHVVKGEGINVLNERLIVSVVVRNKRESDV